MVKTGPKNREPSRRELRQMLRNTPSPAMQVSASHSGMEHQPPSHSPIPPSVSTGSNRSTETLKPISRRLLPRSRKPGGRHKPIVIPSSSAMSPKRRSIILSPVHKRKVSADAEDSREPKATTDLLQALQARFRQTGADMNDKAASLRKLRAIPRHSPMKKNSSVSSRVKGVAPFVPSLRQLPAAAVTPAPPMLPTPADTPVAARPSPLSPLPAVNDLMSDDPFVSGSGEPVSTVSLYAVPLAADTEDTKFLRPNRSNDTGSRIPRPASIVVLNPHQESPVLSLPETPVPRATNLPKPLSSVGPPLKYPGSIRLTKGVPISPTTPPVREGPVATRAEGMQAKSTSFAAPSLPKTASSALSAPEKSVLASAIRPYVPHTPDTGTRPPRAVGLTRNKSTTLMLLNAPRVRLASIDGHSVTTRSRFQKENRGQSSIKTKAMPEKSTSAVPARPAPHLGDLPFRRGFLLQEFGSANRTTTLVAGRPKALVTPLPPPAPKSPVSRPVATDAETVKKTRTSSRSFVRTSATTVATCPPPIMDSTPLPSNKTTPSTERPSASAACHRNSVPGASPMPPSANPPVEDTQDLAKGPAPAAPAGVRGLVRMVGAAFSSPWRTKSPWR